VRRRLTVHVVPQASVKRAMEVRARVEAAPVLSAKFRATMDPKERRAALASLPALAHDHEKLDITKVLEAEAVTRLPLSHGSLSDLLHLVYSGGAENRLVIW
jgi:hypothetical protein